MRLVYLLVVALIASATTLTCDEMWDERSNPEHGLKLKEIGQSSHETVIICLFAGATLLAILSFKCNNPLTKKKT